MKEDYTKFPDCHQEMPIKGCAKNSFEESAFVKEDILRAQLRKTPKILIAYSGGVDSTYLAYIAYEELKEDMLAVIAISPSLADREKKRAIQFLNDYIIPYRIVRTDEMNDPNYTKNDQNRCYHCKRLLFEACQQIIKEIGWKYIAYGFNVDDGADFRPGQTAAQEHRILRPLWDSGFTKQDIRERSKELGLKEPFRPAQPCLASRLMYGTPVTDEHLRVIDSMEELLLHLGFQKCRARYDGNTIRIEVPTSEIKTIVKEPIREKIVQNALSLGVKFVSLDLEGFVSGKLNRLITKN